MINRRRPAVAGEVELLFPAAPARRDFSDDHLAALAGLRHLTRLDLVGTGVTGRGFDVLHAMPRLEQLSLNGTPVNGDGLARLRLPAFDLLHRLRSADRLQRLG